MSKKLRLERDCNAEGRTCVGLDVLLRCLTAKPIGKAPVFPADLHCHKWYEG